MCLVRRYWAVTGAANERGKGKRDGIVLEGNCSMIVHSLLWHFRVTFFLRGIFVTTLYSCILCIVWHYTQSSF